MADGTRTIRWTPTTASRLKEGCRTRVHLLPTSEQSGLGCYRSKGSLSLHGRLRDTPDKRGLVVLACQRPPKRRREAVKTYDDGRQRCRTEAGWQKRRKEVHDREKGLCELCMTYAPLHNNELAFAGHAHHLYGRKHGDDRQECLQWLCGRCHARLHVPEKVLPAKEVV